MKNEYTWSSVDQVHVQVPEPGRSTLNVLNYKYKYFSPRKYLSTSTVLFGKCTKVHSEYFQNVLKYNQEYISITEQFLYSENQTTFLT